MNAQIVQIGAGDRASLVRRGRRLEYFTIGYNSLEGLIAVVAGLIAGSIALVGFGFDSLIEVTSGAVLLWRLNADVVRYGPEELHAEFGDAFEFLESHEESHLTPFETTQKFTYCLFRKR